MHGAKTITRASDPVDLSHMIMKPADMRPDGSIEYRIRTRIASQVSSWSEPVVTCDEHKTVSNGGFSGHFS